MRTSSYRPTIALHAYGPRRPTSAASLYRRGAATPASYRYQLQQTHVDSELHQSSRRQLDSAQTVDDVMGRTSTKQAPTEAAADHFSGERLAPLRRGDEEGRVSESLPSLRQKFDAKVGLETLLSRPSSMPRL